MVADSVAVRRGPESSSSRLHPLKLALWIGCGSIMMMFAAFTSAYIVRKSAGNWLEFPLPLQFYISTAVLLLSSLTLHGAYIAFKKAHEKPYKALLIGTFVLGLAFIVLQYSGWLALTAQGVFLNENPSGSFVYVLSGIHVAHLLGGIAALILALIHAFSLPFQPTKGRKVRLELTLTYWHFVDFLWVYLLAFFIFA